MNQHVDPVTSHYVHSSYREKLIEHLFVGELLKELWCGKPQRLVECLRSEVDFGGYDIALRCGETMRFVQLKASRSSAAAASQKVNVALSKLHGGCVVWIWFNELSLKLERFGFFGGAVGDRLEKLETMKKAMHTKPSADGKKAVRPNIRVVPKSSFTIVQSMDDLINLLLPPSSAS